MDAKNKVTNGEHPSKPRSIYCKLGQLMRWTGWSAELIDSFVREKKLRFKMYVRPGRKRARRYYEVQSAQDLLDE